MSTPTDDEVVRPTRRAAIGSGAGLAVFGAAACSRAADRAAPPNLNASPSSTDTTAGPSPDDLASATQAGLLAPFPIQARGWFAVYTVTTADVPGLLDRLGAMGVSLMQTFATTRLSVTWGVGPRLIREHAPAGRPGTDVLPSFRSDRLPDRPDQADLFVQVRAETDAAVNAAVDTLRKTLDRNGTRLWSKHGDRGPASGDYSRNTLGFFDGIVGPSTEDLPASLWLDPTAGWPGATYAVVRLMPINATAFQALPVTGQEQIFGRHKQSGAPLSGRAITDPVDLQAKSESGDYDIANTAHSRRAHPLVSGAEVLMLRRSYNYRDDGQSGLVFVSFQRDLEIFTQTQHSLDEGDALMDFTYTARSASVVILPAPTPSTGLGGWLTS